MLETFFLQCTNEHYKKIVKEEGEATNPYMIFWSKMRECNEDT